MSLGLQNPAKLRDRLFAVKPVRGLCCRNEINRCVGQSRALCSSGKTGKLWISRQILLAGFPHSLVRFYAIDAIPVFKQQARKDSSTRSHVGYNGFGCEGAFLLQDGENSGRVRWAKARVIPYAQ